MTSDLYLSAFAPDGHTAWAAPLDRKPVFGPELATIDGVETVVIVEARTATYWPLTGGTATVVDLPAGARADTKNPGTSVLFIVGQNRAGYLSAGVMKLVDVLPLTKAVAAVDGGVMQWQEDKHAWWRVTADAPPRRVTATPAIAAAVLPPTPPQARARSTDPHRANHRPADGRQRRSSLRTHSGAVTMGLVGITFMAWMIVRAAWQILTWAALLLWLILRGIWSLLVILPRRAWLKHRAQVEYEVLIEQLISNRVEP